MQETWVWSLSQEDPGACCEQVRTTTTEAHASWSRWSSTRGVTATRSSQLDGSPHSATRESPRVAKTQHNHKKCKQIAEWTRHSAPRLSVHGFYKLSKNPPKFPIFKLPPFYHQRTTYHSFLQHKKNLLHNLTNVLHPAIKTPDGRNFHFLLYPHMLVSIPFF